MAALVNPFTDPPVNPFILPKTLRQRRRGLKDEWNDPDTHRITHLNDYQPRYWTYNRYTVDMPYFEDVIPDLIDTVSIQATNFNYTFLERALLAVADPLHTAQSAYIGRSLAGPPPQLGITPEILRAWADLMRAVWANGSVNAYLV
jgi:hypothetical protein